MYLRILFEETGGEIVAWVDRELEGLPIRSTVRRWKREVYFETPLEVEGEKVVSVVSGDVAYWPPGKALCLFYGFSQPYSPVVRLGAVVGVPELLASVEEGVSVRVDPYRDYGSEGEVAKALREKGIKAASHSWEGDEYVGALVEGAGSRVGVEISVEDYGFHVQTQPIAFFDNTPPTTAFAEAVKRELEPTGVRLDLDEEGYLVLTAFFRSLEELDAGLRRMLSIYVYVKRFMEAFYGVRRPA